MLRQFGQGLPSHEQAIAHRAVQALVQAGRLFFDLLPRTDHELGCRGWRGRPEIGDEIGDGEIGFVTYGRNDRNLRRSNGARQRLVIE